MTWWKHHYKKKAYYKPKPKPEPEDKKFEFTAFKESDLLKPGDHNLGLCDKFTMPAAATTCITVCDDDHRLSGDMHRNEKGDDRSGQKATIEYDHETVAEDVKIYAESIYTLRGSDGKTYHLVEIEMAGAHGSSDYFSFKGDVPPAGTELHIVCCDNIKSVRYDDLGAGEKSKNEAPLPADDAAKLCAGEDVKIDVLANDVDPDDDDLTITSIVDAGDDGVLGTADDVSTEIGDGGTVTLSSGATVMLMDGQLLYDSGDAFDDVLITDTATDVFGYHVSDGAGGVGEAQVDIEIKGALNTVETIEASLPGLACFQLIDENDPAPLSDEAFTIRLSGVGDERFDGLVIEEAYCLAAFEDFVAGDASAPIEDAPLLKANLYIAHPSEVPSGALSQDAVDNLDLINWILNQDFGSLDNGDGQGETYTDAEIQGAIWGLTDDIVFVADGGGTQSNAQEILDLAVANGEGFKAGEGDVIGLILDPTSETEDQGHSQPFILAVAFEQLEQECVCPDEGMVA